MNIGVHVSFGIMVFSRYMPRIGIAGSYGSSIFNFLRNLHTVWKIVVVKNYIPCAIVHKASTFSTSLPALIISCLLCDTHSNRNKVISYCGFICISLMISDVQYIYMYQLATWMSPFKKCLFSSSAHYLTRFFVVLLLSYMSSLYILDINHLSDR